MCGRFTLDIPSETLAELFGLADPPALAPRYNIAPTQRVAAVRQHPDGGNRLEQLHWGLIPSWARDRSAAARMINARSETAAEKPAFRQAVRYRRCLVLASGFYEWKQEGKMKVPLYIRLRGDVPMAFAGLWESWRSPEGETVESCTILTTSPNRLVEPVHDRMPVILHADEYGAWLSRSVTDPASLGHLFKPYPADLMEMWPVSTQVNSPRNESPDLVMPVEDSRLFLAACCSPQPEAIPP